MAIAHKDADYLISETVSVAAAWTINPAIVNYLYVDINHTTGARTFGVTHIKPVVGSASPGYVEDMHWFDTTNRVMKVCRLDTWIERIRIFVGAVSAGQRLSPVTWTSAGTFVGTQVSLTVPCDVTPILFDEAGRIITRTNGTLLTVGTSLRVGSTTLHPVNANSTIIQRPAKVTLQANRAVRLDSDGFLQLADYSDIGRTIVGFITKTAPIDTMANMFLTGIVTDNSWNWTRLNSNVWVSTNGELTDIDPNKASPASFPVGRPAIGKVIAPNAVLFNMNGVITIAETISGGNPDMGPVIVTSPQPGDTLVMNSSLIWVNQQPEININGGFF